MDRAKNLYKLPEMVRKFVKMRFLNFTKKLPKIIGTNHKNQKCSKLPKNGEKIYQSEILDFVPYPRPRSRNPKIFSQNLK